MSRKGSKDKSRGRSYFVPLVRRILLVLILALLGVFLFQLFDLLILDDWLDFNDSMGGNLLLYAIFLVVAWFVTSSKFHILHQIAQHEYATALKNKLLSSVALQFRVRAARLRRSAYLLLGIIVIVLATGFATFRLAERSAVRIDNFYVQDLRGQISDLRETIREAESDTTLSEDYGKYLIEELSQEERRLRTRLASLGETLPSDESTLFLVSTLSTKIGSVLLLLFLVQILVNLYRYNMRLASFYDSRADFLQLLGTTDNIHPETLAKIVGTDKFEFGKTPSAPTEQLYDLAKEISALSSRK